MSVQGLQNPFERLSVLPTTVSWRGTWVDSETYFKNDVVVSPVNASSYILTGTTSVNQNGLEPSVSPLWSQFSNTSTGIESVNGLAPGIFVNNTNPLQPIISNTGVLTVTAGAAINVINTDPQNPIIESTAISALAQGTGIQIGGTPQIPIITNSGVLQIIGGVGMSVSNPTGDVTVSNTGLISVIAGAGIQVIDPDPSNPTIGNSGVISLATGAGLASTGGQNPNISNTGVLSVLPLDTSVTIDNTDPQNPIISSEAPFLSVFSLSTSYPNVVILPNASGLLLVNTAGSGLFAQYVLNGAPNPQGAFLIDFTSLSLNFIQGSSQVTSAPFSLNYKDFTTVGGPYTYTSTTFPSNYFLSLGQTYPLQASLSQSYFNVAEARATGMRVVTHIQLTNGTNANMTVATSGGFFAVYYPNGVE
jgi:hypothetical protein